MSLCVESTSGGAVLSNLRDCKTTPTIPNATSSATTSTYTTDNGSSADQGASTTATEQPITSVGSKGQISSDLPKNNMNLSKIIVASAPNQAATSTQKVVNSTSVITVVNTPITVVKTIGGELVNSSVGRTQPTITLVNAPPITFKTISDTTSKIDNQNNVINGGLSVTSISEMPTGIHNVFVKKSSTAEGGPASIPDMPQSHKLLTANSFPTANVIPTLNTGPILKTANGQRPINVGSKVKILSNVVMSGNSTNASGPASSNVLLNKTQQRLYPPKVVNNGVTKYLNKPAEKRLMYPTHKSQLKPLAGGYKSPSSTNSTKNLNPGSMQRTGTGLRTIPPQKQPISNKPNYIGKHAVQAHRVKPKFKTKLAANKAIPHVPEQQSAQMIFNQALTAQILETLSDKDSSSKISIPNSYISPKYDLKSEVPVKTEQHQEYRASGCHSLDALSFVCHAVLLDHNYNATLPADPSPPPTPTLSQLNGNQYQHQPPFSPIQTYSPAGITAIKRNRTTSQSTVIKEEDASSDVSDDRKIDTEGEETDTAPEAEAVTNDANDRYGDYVTRCICGFIHDDGYMIECDKCKVWQHVRCVVRSKKVPDEFLCEICDPNKVTDKIKARQLQQQYMREIQERDAKLRKEQMAVSDSDSSDSEVQKQRRKEIPPRRQRREAANKVCKPTKRKERKVPMKRAKSKVPTPKSDEELLPQLRQWIENYEEAVTNHYSPELRARIASIRVNGAHSELNGHVDPSVNKCKVQGISNGLKCLISSVSLPMGTPIIELRGKYMLSTQHRSTTRQQRPGPFLFFHTLIKDTEICVDTRTYGNSARFIRRSCTPNAELQHVIEKGTVHLYIVTTKSVDKGSELTIRHESHEIAAQHLTEFPCACLNSEYCALLKSKRLNGDLTSPQSDGRKRRGRNSRDNVMTSPPPQMEKPPPSPLPVSSQAAGNVAEVMDEKEENTIKVEIDVKVKAEPSETVAVKQETVEEKEEQPSVIIKEEPEETKVDVTDVKEETVEADEEKTLTPVATRRTSRHTHDQNAESNQSPINTEKENDKQSKKLSREERKLEAIMKAIERMEKQEQRKQEHQAKQAHRRESEPSSTSNSAKDKDDGPRLKRRKRKGRTRTVSTNSRRNRLDSADSMHSSDDTLMSPNSENSSPTKAAGLLLSLSNNDASRKSPDRIMESNSNSAHSSPETPLSTACLQVAAAIEPLEPGFKFPKTKKVLMNEWLNKDLVQSAPVSPSLQSPVENFAKSLSTPNSGGSAKKRWLRQAISEDQCDSPPQATDTIAPPKKRRLPRESLSSENSPSSTPVNELPLVEIVTPNDDDSPTSMESEATLNELASEMHQEYGNCVQLPSRVQEITTPSVLTNTPPPQPLSTPQPDPPTRTILDPRLASRLNSEQLVGTVEKTLNLLGYGGPKKPETITPTKRKLSITEYRQRKKLNNNEKSVDESLLAEESNSSQSPKPLRPRSNSCSSVTSGSVSDEDVAPPPAPTIITGIPDVKALPGFNSEPTELERQRESAALRIKKVLGMPVTENDLKKPQLDVDTFLKGDLLTPPGCVLLNPSLTKAAASHVSIHEGYVRDPSEDDKHVDPQEKAASESSDNRQENTYSNSAAEVMFYVPDEEEACEQDKFVNPLFGESDVAKSPFGAVVEEDAYEGRNPSPPPHLGAT